MRFVLFALALLTTPAAAQDTLLRPGDVDVSSIQPYAYEYEVHIVAPMQQRFGSATETLTIDGDEAVTVISVNGQGVQQTDSVTVEWPTFAPVRQVSIANGAVETFDYSPNAVSGVLRSGSPVDATLEAPIFGPGTSDAIARVMLLEEGATAQFVSFDKDAPDTPKTTTLTTTGQEEVLGRTAWIVTADDGDVTTFAFDAETGETLRVSFSPQPGVVVELRRSNFDAAE